MEKLSSLGSGGRTCVSRLCTQRHQFLPARHTVHRMQLCMSLLKVAYLACAYLTTAAFVFHCAYLLSL